MPALDQGLKGEALEIVEAGGAVGHKLSALLQQKQRLDFKVAPFWLVMDLLVVRRGTRPARSK